VSAVREHNAAGLEYLELVTTLLQTARLADPTAGVWEAADLQWWWRRDQHLDPNEATFWLDGERPIAGSVCMNWGDYIEGVVTSADPDGSPRMELAWPHLRHHIDTHREIPVEMIIRDDDAALIDAVMAAGFEPGGEMGVSTWMPASERPAVPLPPPGFEVVARNEASDRPHPFVSRSGEHVAERLGECSLYRPDLDLAVYDPEGALAGYALFWADPVTGVGLLEPMRTEDAFQRMGIGRLLLAAGLEGLAAHGCTRLKVSYIVGNDASRALYLGAGFHPGSRDRTYRRTG
jgi:GNAT superfamily N-acetyltransferase